MAQWSERTNNHKTGEGLIPSNRWGEEINIDSHLVERRLLEIKNKIAPCKPKIVGVTKYYGLNAIIEGYKAGLRDFGESRAIDAIAKIESLPDEIKQNSTFHFIGHLQTNKADKVVKYFDYIQSVDSLKIATAISKSAKDLNKTIKILLQVNIAEEEQKFGYSVSGLKNDLPELKKLDSIEIAGLMCMAKLGASSNESSATFKQLRELRDSLQNGFGINLPELSMGMSDDYSIAAENGATIIRIGRKLFN